MEIKVEKDIDKKGTKLIAEFTVNTKSKSGPCPPLYCVDKMEILKLLWEIRSIIISKFLSKGIV